MIAALALLGIQKAVFSHAPTAEYTSLNMSGFTVLVSPDAMADKAATEKALGLLHTKLAEVARIVPRAALEKLRTVKVWVERGNPDNPGAVYHPTSTWLKDHGYNPDKARCVEIGNVRNFVDWSQRIQPMMVMHELAHAYHHQVRTYDDEGIKEAFASAVSSGTYEKVAFVSGGERRHYALTNAMEYFAESSEAYFGMNDFYPFDRWQLIKHDRPMYEVLVAAWGLPSGQSKVIGSSATTEVLKGVGRYRG